MLVLRSTGVPVQLQKIEDSQPETLEFERLKEHFEPLIRSSGATGNLLQASQHQHHPQSAAQQAASSALSRELPVLRRSLGQRTNSSAKSSAPAAASGSGKKGGRGADSTLPYKARIEVASGMGLILDNELEWLRELGKPETEAEGFGFSDVSELNQRWAESWAGSIKKR
jgi:dynactin 4